MFQLLPLLLTIISCVLIVSCNATDRGKAEKILVEKLLVEGVKQDLLSEKTIVSALTFNDVYNVETGLWFSYPDSYIKHQKDNYDTLFLSNRDSSIHIRKWYDDNTLPIELFDKDGDGDVDSTLDKESIRLIYRNSIENYKSSLNEGAIIRLSSDSFETVIELEEGIKKRIVKILLCDVVGGTQIPIYLDIVYDADLAEVANEIEGGFHKGFIKGK